VRLDGAALDRSRAAVTRMPWAPVPLPIGAGPGGQHAGMRARHLLKLWHAQTCQAADGMAQVSQLLQQGQSPHVVF